MSPAPCPGGKNAAGPIHPDGAAVFAVVAEALGLQARQDLSGSLRYQGVLRKGGGGECKGKGGKQKTHRYLR